MTHAAAPQQAILLEQRLAALVGEAWRLSPPVPAALAAVPGMAAVAPLLVAFVHWLGNQNPGNGPVFCVLREGRLLRRLLAAVAPQVRVGEISLNRRLCLKAAILSATDEEGLLNFLVRARRQPLTVAEAGAELRLPVCPLSPAALLAADSAALAGFLDWVREAGPATALAVETERLRHGLRAHLAAAGALDAERLVLADLGYAGNIQNAVEKILRADGGGGTLGLYLLTTPGMSWVERRGGEVRSFLAHGGQPAWLTRLFARSPEPLEALCGCGDGPLVDYAADGRAVTAAALLPAEQMRLVTKWQDVLVAEAGGMAVCPVEQARLALARFLALPSLAEARALAPFVYEETMTTSTLPLASPATCADPWQVPRAELPWPAAAARLAGWDDDALLRRLVAFLA